MPTSSTSCRVAICDDVPDFRRVLSLLLGSEPGIELVGEAGNGREAIELVETTEVDVLLLDLAMPIMDGMVALPRIVEASPTTRVVMLTGFGSDAIRRQAFELGASSFVEKGSTPSEIIAAVTDACSVSPT